MVVLSELNCDCLAAQDQEGPCRHVHGFCQHLRMDPELYTSGLYSVNMYNQTYQEITPPLVFDLDAIEEDERFTAPTAKPFQGRKQVKRKRKGERPGKQNEGQARGWCNKAGHNIRSCDDPEQVMRRQRNRQSIMHLHNLA